MLKSYLFRLKSIFIFVPFFSKYNDIHDMHALYSNKYLDVLFEPQWQRYGVDLGDVADAGLVANGNGQG